MGKATRNVTVFSAQRIAEKYEAIQWAFVEFIKKVATFEQRILVVADENQKRKSKYDGNSSCCANQCFLHHS
jgi:hypothetical protein